MTSSALRPPELPVNVPTGTGLDTVLVTMQLALSTISWLGNLSLGRITPKATKDNKVEPWVYKGNNEYYPAYPNDSLPGPAFSALYAFDDETTDDDIFFDRTVSVIVWANMSKLQIEPPSVEGLKRDVRRTLNNLDCVMSEVSAVDQTAAGANGIYADIAPIDVERYLTAPFAGFRIDFRVYYADLCNINY